jgi:hypothetical protein
MTYGKVKNANTHKHSRHMKFEKVFQEASGEQYSSSDKKPRWKMDSVTVGAWNLTSVQAFVRT